MRAGVPLAKIDNFKDLLEDHAYSLTDRRGMCDLIPFVQSEEQQRIRSELQGKKISVIFDGTTWLGEALVVVVRFIDGFVVKQCLVRFLTLAKSMTGEEIAKELISALSVEYGITSERLLAAMRDRASVNAVAMRTIKVVFPDMIDVGCYSHTIDLVGDKFRAPNIDNFIRLWVSLFAHSPRARLWWKGRTGKAMSSYSSTRWWSKWEVMSQIMSFFGDVAPFLHANPELSPATNRKLLQMLQNPTVKAYVQIELAAIVDAGEAFVKATYNLEGDGPLVLRCYEILSTLTASIQVGHYPNVQAVARTLSGGSPVTLQQWVEYANTCIKPGLQYFLDKFSQEFLNKFSQEFLNTASILANLKSELPSYLAKAADIDAEIDPLV